MKKSILLLFLFSCVCATNAQSTKNGDSDTSRLASPRAKMVVLSTEEAADLHLLEDEFDFGRIPQGKPVNHKFKFVNSGKDSLKIAQVTASCGCTTPEWTKEMLPPGDTSSIVVGFDAADEGDFYRSVTIIYNGNRVKQVYIRGRVFATPTEPAPPNKIVEILNDRNR